MLLFCYRNALFSALLELVGLLSQSAHVLVGLRMQPHVVLVGVCVVLQAARFFPVALNAFSFSPVRYSAAVRART